MEHSPIEEPPPRLRRPLGQRTDFRIDGLDAKTGCQICRSEAGLPAHVDIQPARGNPDTQVGTGQAIRDPATDLRRAAGCTNQNPIVGGAEGAAPAQEIDRFEEGGLPGAIGAGKDIQAWIKAEFACADTAEIPDPKVG